MSASDAFKGVFFACRQASAPFPPNDQDHRMAAIKLPFQIRMLPPFRCIFLILIMSLPERANQSNTVDTVMLKVGKLPTD